MKGMTVRVQQAAVEHLLQKVKTGQELGFENFDLCISTPKAPLAEIIRAVQSSGGKVRTVRFTDNPEKKSAGASFTKLAVTDNEERRKSVEAIIHACDAIGGSDVQSIVVDGGAVDFNGATGLETLIEACLEDEGTALDELVRTASMRRAAYLNPNLEALCRSIYEIIAATEKVVVAVLTPRSPLGICLPNEMEHVLMESGGKRRGYWHSTCAARWLEKLGVVQEEVWLDRFGRRMKGVYLGDAIGAQGDQAPGIGEVDFKRLKPYLGKDTARMLTIADDTSCIKLKYGAEYLGQIGIF